MEGWIGSSMSYMISLLLTGAWFVMLGFTLSFTLFFGGTSLENAFKLTEGCFDTLVLSKITLDHFTQSQFSFLAKIFKMQVFMNYMGRNSNCTHHYDCQ